MLSPFLWGVSRLGPKLEAGDGDKPQNKSHFWLTDALDSLHPAPVCARAAHSIGITSDFTHLDQKKSAAVVRKDPTVTPATAMVAESAVAHPPCVSPEKLGSKRQRAMVTKQ